MFEMWEFYNYQNAQTVKYLEVTIPELIDKFEKCSSLEEYEPLNLQYQAIRFMFYHLNALMIHAMTDSKRHDEYVEDRPKYIELENRVSKLDVVIMKLNDAWDKADDKFNW